MTADMTFIDIRKTLEALLDAITTTSPTDDDEIPRLYIDLEGTKLSRNGTVALLTLMIHPQMDTYIIDVTSLGKAAFTIPNSAGDQTLKSVLESEIVAKVFYDVRRDLDALFAHFGIRLAGIHDLQLMELAARPKHLQKNYLAGLGKCIEHDAQLSKARRNAAAAIKEKGIRLFDPNRGGNYAVFDARPLIADIKSYCVQDVQHVSKLWTVYHGKMSKFWRDEVLKETRARIHASQQEDFEPYRENMALAPAHWAGLRE